MKYLYTILFLIFSAAIILKTTVHDNKVMQDFDSESLLMGAIPVTLDLQSFIEPPMTLSRELPVTLSYENKRSFLQNPLLLDQEAKQNVTLLKNKAFPWLAIISAMTVLLVITIIRQLPAKETEQKADPLRKKKNEIEIKQELQNMTLNMPKDSKEAAVFITRLDFLLRLYLLNRYEIPAFCFTKEELIDNTNTFKDLTSSMKEGMNAIFIKADQIKFAQASPDLYDCENLIRTIKQIIL